MPPGNFEQLPSEIESEGIFSGLSPFNVPVDIVRCTKLLNASTIFSREHWPALLALLNPVYTLYKLNFKK